MITYPCISIRQPWAWLILNGYKDIENRTWATKHRGQILIHASGTKTPQTYREAQQFMAAQGIDIALPPVEELPVKGIVGYAQLVDVVANHPSPWAMDDHLYWVLKSPRPVEFVPLGGLQGIFPVEGHLLPPFMGVQL